MITAGIAVLMGVILACFQAHSIDIFWISLLPLCLFLIYFNPPVRSVWLLCASFLYASLHIHLQLEQRPEPSLNNRKLSLVGEVIDIPRAGVGSTRFIFKPESNPVLKLPGRIRLAWRNPPQSLKAGQRWRLSMKIKRAHGFQNPGGFDYERWLFVKGIHATGYVLEDSGNSLLDNNKLSINRFRQDINDWIIRHCADCRYPGLLLALSTGYRGELRESGRILLQDTGTAHLIAISGLHIGIIAGFAFFLARKSWDLMLFHSRFNRIEFCWLVCWLSALLYSLLSGFELPAQRAFLMLTVLCLLFMLRLPMNLLNSVMTTLIAVLLFSPLAVLSESFWLTLCALSIILLGSFILRGESSRWKQLFTIQLLFSLLFIPLTMLIFGQVHSASLLANLVAVPLVSLFIVPLNFMLLGLFWLPDSWLELAYHLVDKLIGLLIGYLQLLQQFGLQAIQVPALNLWQLLLIVVFMLLLVFARSLPGMRAWLYFLPVVFFWPRNPPTNELLWVTVLDVGTGNAVVLQTRYHSLIYDFGPGNRLGYSAGQRVVVPYLRHRGIDKVDRIVISHSDQDHAGGLYSVIDQFKDVPLYSGTVETLKQKFPQLQSIQDCYQASDWRWDGVDFEFLTTTSIDPYIENNRSCVLRISMGSQVILLMGDIESSQEQTLVNEKAHKLKAAILLAPHHGSRSSSSPEFIDAVSAGHVIFSSGYLNRWSFPKTEIVTRYQQSSARIYRTDQDGAIQIECDSDNCRVVQYRQLYPHIWY